MSLNHEKLKLYLQWDELAWSTCLDLFKHVVIEKKITNGVEIAANKGGISLYFATELGVSMLCTDLDNPEKRFDETYKNTDKNKLKFAALNGLKLELADNSIDMLVFKSFLGGMRTLENQKIAMAEIFRILKPGGVLFFAENLNGSLIHQGIRRLLVPWGATWRYVKMEEMKEFLSPFSDIQIKTFGFFSAFGKINVLKKVFYKLDKSASLILPSSMKYICYGYAIK